jgi:hypothetical protein
MVEFSTQNPKFDTVRTNYFACRCAAGALFCKVGSTGLILGVQRTRSLAHLERIRAGLLTRPDV